MTSLTEAGALLDRALAEGAPVVDAVTPDDLDRDTPCAGWDLRALLAHVLGQYDGFARAVRDGDAEVNAFQPRQPAPLTVAEDWRTAAEAFSRAVASAPPDRPVRLAEISDELRFPLPTVVGMQFVDTLVHTWDVARSIGRPYRPAPDLVAACLAIARQIPDGEQRRRPGAAFAPVVAAPDGADDWDVTLALLGRDPGR
jgi:uncharacterized protein (TIGR03086 family)